MAGVWWVICEFELKTFYLGKSVLESLKIFLNSLRSLRMFRLPLRVTLHKTLTKRRVTELSNLRGLAQVLVFSHGSGAPVILRVRGRR